MKREDATRTILISFLLLFLPLGVAAQILSGGGNVRYTPKGAAPVVFNHEKHIEAKGHVCSACHFGVFLMDKESLKMNMDKMTKGHFCGTCHNGKDSFDVADPAQCKKCHQ